MEPLLAIRESAKIEHKGEHMTLRKKALLIIGVTLISVVGLVYIASRFILLEDLADIEEHQAHQHVERAMSTLYSSISNLKTTTVDWAAWDATYAFIEDANSEYIESNLNDETFITLKLNLKLFIDSSGQIVFSKAFDILNEEEVPLASGMKKYISDNRPLLEQPGTEGSKAGFILLKEGPMLITSWPILTSEDEGPARGTLIFGRYFDYTEVERLAHVPRIDS